MPLTTTSHQPPATSNCSGRGEHPYNMPAVERIVTVSETTPSKSNPRRETVSPANFLDWRRDLAGT